ncbi:GLPGLI family protein [Flavobacterium sp.]|uniref:GLPGLI family protein n=1 Tax=Flavobacterium sp. TaxID=239 RepID=UPI003D0A5783
MKKEFLGIILFLLFINSQLLFSQCGKINYKISVTEPEIKSADVKERFSGLIDEARKQNYELNFNGTASSFDVIKSIASNSEQENYFSDIARLAFGSRYKTIVDRQNNIVYELTDDKNVLKTENAMPNWKISSESKQIEQYSCYKATYEEFFINRKGIKSSRVITAWFAPSLPYSFGPKSYFGLPGLILELTENKTTFLATRINLIEGLTKIELPKGKTITREEYDNKLKAQMGM